LRRTGEPAGRRPYARLERRAAGGRRRDDRAGWISGISASDQAVDAIELALSDAGLNNGDVDGLITCRNLHTRQAIDEPPGRQWRAQ